MGERGEESTCSVTATLAKPVILRLVLSCSFLLVLLLSYKWLPEDPRLEATLENQETGCFYLQLESHYEIPLKAFSLKASVALLTIVFH